MPTLSVAIITKNESRNITRCIQSVLPIADEVVVVDSHSTDNTVALAQDMGARVVLQDFLGYVEQKNFAKDQCQSDYVLSLDADEALSEQLQQNLSQLKPNLKAAAYEFNRLTNIGSTWIKHSGWYPDKKTRLFAKNSGQWGGTNPHDKYILNEAQKPVWVAGDLLHYSFENLEDHKKQSMRFAQIAAQALHSEGKKGSWAKMVYKPLAAFVKCFLIKGGWMDLHYGWPIATIAARAKYQKYSRLYQLQQAR